MYNSYKARAFHDVESEWWGSLCELLLYPSAVRIAVVGEIAGRGNSAFVHSGGAPVPSSEAELPNFLNLADMVWNNSGRDIPQFLCVRVRVPAFNSRAPAFNSCAFPRPQKKTPGHTFDNTGPCLQKSSNVSAGVFRDL